MCVCVLGGRWEIRLPWQQPDYNCPGVALIPLHPGQLVLFTANQGASNLSERAISQVEGSGGDEEEEEERRELMKQTNRKKQQ